MDALRSLPESRLPAALRERLPESTPGPPWHCQVRAVVWVQRALGPLPYDAVGGAAVRRLVVGAVVDYLDSPVGAYREVFAGPLLRGTLLPVVRIPFIAVDSLPSVHGGRTHWSLPKAMASFTGDVGSTTVAGDGWTVQVSARAAGPRLPLRGPLVNDQTGRRAVVSLRGRVRLARVRVDAEGPVLKDWLGSGRHLGVVAEGTMEVRAPR